MMFDEGISLIYHQPAREIVLWTLVEDVRSVFFREGKTPNTGGLFSIRPARRIHVIPSPTSKMDVGSVVDHGAR